MEKPTAINFGIVQDNSDTDVWQKIMFKGVT